MKRLVLRLSFAAALACGANASASTFLVTSSTSGSTTRFVVSRDDASAAETVLYRTAALSAFPNQHFTAASGTLTFPAGQTAVTNFVTERTPSADAYKFQTGSNRSYRFEITDIGGFPITNAVRTFNTGTSVSGSNAFASKDLPINTGIITVTDGGYDQAYHSANVNSYFNAAAPKDYLVAAGAQLRATVTFHAREKEDGYQYVAIYANTPTTDVDTGAKDGDPGTISSSRYMAGFTIDGNVSSTYYPYTFPLASKGDSCGEQTHPWSGNGNGSLQQQYFNTGCRASDGRLIIPTSLDTLYVRLNASGNLNDTWYASNVVAHVQAVDTTAPTKSAVSVAPGVRARGNDLFVSVAFSEPVTSSSATLSTTWGKLSYDSGNGSNVLTFKGAISDAASGSLGITNRSGTIKDLAGNSLSGSLNQTGLASLDASHAYAISCDLAGGSASNPTAYTYDSDDIVLANPTRTGYVFDGWSGTGFSGLTNAVTIPARSHGDRAYAAHWTPVEYAVRFAAPDADSGSMPDQTFAYDAPAPFSSNAFARAHYAFAGWSGAGRTFADGETVLNLTNESATVTLTATWTPAPTWTGAGTAESPYLIYNRNQLDDLAAYVNANDGSYRDSVYRLMADIAYDPAATNSFTPIGRFSSRFQGVFDGNGHTVSGISIRRPGTDCQGFFGCLDGATVKDLTLADSSIEGDRYVGGLFGYAGRSTIERCFVNGTSVAGNSDRGAFGGNVTDCNLIKNAYHDCTMDGSAATYGIGNLGDAAGVWPCGTLSFENGVAPIFGPDYAFPVYGATNSYYAAGGRVDVRTPVAGATVFVDGSPAGVSGAGGVFSFSMPDGDATVSSAVAYLDENGNTQYCTSYTVVTNADADVEYGQSYETSWYVVDGDVAIDGTLRFLDTYAHLILCDGATLAVTNASGSGYAIDAEDLFIYGQVGGTGAIAANGGSRGISAYSVTVNGGSVTADSDSESGRGISADGFIVVNGGNINATGNYGIRAGRSLTINGGNITADGSLYGIYSNGGTVTIGGGTVVATGGSYGIDARYGITLGWTDYADSINASGYHSASGTVSVQNGQALTDGTAVYQDTIEDPAALARKTLRPATTWARLQTMLDAGGAVSLHNDVTATGGDSTLTVSTAVTLDLNGHTIDAAGRFGVIEVGDGGDLTLTNSVPESGAVTGGKAGWGGGVCVSGGTFTMTGGAISGNTAHENGGGVLVDVGMSTMTGGTFTMTGGEISGNTAADGGGVYVFCGDFTMAGGAITGNTADYGGGVDVDDTFTMTGGIVSGNTADYGGGGVSVHGTFTVSGSPVVSGNTNSVGAANNVFVPSERTIAVDGLAADASIGVTTKDAPTVAAPVAFATGAAAGDKARFFSDDPGRHVEQDGGTLLLADGIAPVPYIDADGTVRLCTAYTVLANAAGGVEYGASGAENWYVVAGDVSIGGNLRFLDGTARLILRDGATLAVTNASGNAVDADGLAIYGQPGGVGALAVDGGGWGIRADGALAVNGGVVSATGGDGGISAGAIALGWTKSSDRIFASGYGGAVAIRPGRTFTDGTVLYQGSPAPADLAGRTLRPAVPYVDGDGVGRLCTDFTVLTSSDGDVEYGEYGGESWYVVTTDVTIGGQLYFRNYIAHLILCDGATLTVTNASGDAIFANNPIAIYGQAGGTGAVVANGNYGIHVGVFGTVTINGGHVTATGVRGIYAENGNVTINGGNVTAGNGIYATGTVTINGGTVTATGGIGIGGGHVAINGGNVSATGSNCGIFANNGDIILGWTNPDDSIYASSYDSPNGPVTVNRTLTDGDSAYGGPVAPDDIAGKTLRPPMPAIPYLDADGVERRRYLYTVLTSADTDVVYGTAGAENWYAVTNAVTVSGKLSFADDHPRLILCDGASLAVTNSTPNDDAIYADYDLTIYGQTNGTGTVIATGNRCCIFAYNDLAINGGNVTATGSFIGLRADVDLTINGGTVNATGNECGITIVVDGGSVTINGGNVTAAGIGEHGYGIHAEKGSVTINGGSVTVTGEHYGIFANYDLAINGGAVTAEGSICGIYANGNITLGWTDPTDSIYASRYDSPGGSVSVKAGQSLTDGTSVYQGENPDIDGKTLRPCLSWKELQARLDAGGSVALPNDVTAAAGDAPLVVTNAVTLDLNGHALVFNGSKEVFHVGAGGDLALTNRVEGAGAVTGGGDHGVYVGSNAVFRLRGGAIAGNVTDYAGGGVFVDRFGTFEMSGGSITNNAVRTGNDSGGGVYVVGDGTFTMSGGEISGNTAEWAGGGVYVDEDAAFTMTGGEISGNTANYGGGVYVNGGAFTMTGGEISGHTATYGGGVYIYGSMFTMSGGEISGNAASDGGGVYVDDGTFTMTGGTISGNAADDRGGGVYVSSGTFSVSGSPVVSCSTNSVGTANNVYLKSGDRISVGGLSTGASLGVTTEDAPTVSSPVAFATGAAAGDAAHFFSDKSAFAVEAADGGILRLVRIATPWDLLQAQLDAGGTVTLASDVTATEGDATLTVTNAVTLDLNGHTIDAAGRFGVIEIGGGGDLTLTNGVPVSGAVTGGRALEGGGVYVRGAFTMTGGEISGNTAYDGGGVYVNDGGTFTMSGGTISDNSADYAGGVEVYGTFTMSGGEISGNTATYYGGGVCVDDGAFTMTGGEISDNTATYGGGVYVDWYATFAMSGGTVSGNAADDDGGGAYVDYSGTFTVSGSPVVSGNMNSVGAANNVHLYGNTITVDGLSSGARLGVTTATAPTESSSVVFATGAAAGDEAHFFSDNPSYRIGFENGTLRLFLGTVYPAYLAGAEECITNNWLAWAGRHGAVTNDEYEAAFLLDVAPAALATCTGALLRVSAFAPTEGGARLELACDIPGYRFFQPEGDDVTVLGNGFVGLAVARDLAALAGETRPIPVLATVDAATGRAVLDLDFGLYLQALGAPPGYTPPLPASLFARPVLTPVRPDLEAFRLLVAEP